MFDNKAETIKDRLTMQDVLTHYGYKVNRAGFICCPFHNEKTASMKIYPTGYNCFGCGENGDILAFVSKLFGVSFPDTLKRLDDDFNLGLYADKSFKEMRKSHYKQRQLQAKRQREKAERERAEAQYWAVFDEWQRLTENKRKYAPQSPDEELHPLFVEALKKIAYQEYLLECVEAVRIVYERTNNTDA